MSAPTQTTIKRLFALSGNRCAFPNCSNPIVEDDGVVTGEICHIRAASKLGPRFDENQSMDDRHSFNNLILLCSRHHKIIDTKQNDYSPFDLELMKKNHENPNGTQISPEITRVAKQLLDNYLSITIHSNSGQIAIQSPGAIQAHNLTIKTQKQKVMVAPPPGSIAGNRSMISYVQYLIGRYQEFQKSDTNKTDKFKYMAIHQSLKKNFKGDWKLLSEARFNELSAFLQRKIDNTKLGRINKSRSNRNYHSFEDHDPSSST